MQVASPPRALFRAPSQTQRDFERECVGLFSELAQVLGVPRSVGQIYGLLFASPDPLSFTDITHRLNLSRGSVSQGMRALREMGAIRPVEASDSRREHFAPETELRKLIAGFLRGSFEPQLRRGTGQLMDFKARHGTKLEAEGEAGRVLLFRLAKLQLWHRKAAAAL